MSSKFNCGDIVVIKICDIVGMVISLSTFYNNDTIRYEVCYPDEDKLPKYGYFFSIELELAENTEFGFSKKD